MKKLIPLWIIIFISFFCYSSMLTIFVPLLQGKLSPLYTPEYTTAYRNILAGIFLALYPLGQFLGSPVIGSLSDKIGRKKVLTGSSFLTVICLVVIAYSIVIKSLMLLAISCFIAGLGESNMAIALSAIADLTTAETRSTAFARAWVMCSLGYITGSMFGGVASFIGYIYPFIIEAVLVMLMLLSIIVYFVDTTQQKTTESIKVILLNFANIFSKTTLRPYYMANFLLYIACFGILRVELLYMQGYYQLTQLQIAVFYSYASVMAMIANFLLTPLLLSKMSVQRIVIFAGFTAFMSGVIFVLPTQTAFLWLTTGLIGVFVPITVAMAGALISGKSKLEHQGAVMGNNQSLQVLAEAFSATIGGLIFSLNQQAPFIIFAIIGIASLTIHKQASTTNRKFGNLELSSKECN